jgi:hypothetical protein
MDEGSRVSVKTTNFTSNFETACGGAVQISGTQPLTFDGTTSFDFKMAAKGGGICTSRGSRQQEYNCTGHDKLVCSLSSNSVVHLHSNQAREGGGALFIFCGTGDGMKIAKTNSCTWC